MRQTFLILIISLAIIQVQAQEATEEPTQSWDIVERCVGEPVEPPEDWTFEGTILATGWAGVHGINAAWDVPHVLAFRVSPSNGDWDIEGTSISPDGQWQSILYGETFRHDNGYTVLARELVVENLSNSGEVYRVSLPAHDEGTYFWNELIFRYSGFVEPYWWDSEHVVIRDSMVNPFTGEASNLPINIWKMNAWGLSPDRTREAASTASMRLDPELRFLDKDGESIELADVEMISDVSWANDSSFFVASLLMKNEDFKIVIVNRDAEIIDDILLIERFHRLGALSVNNRYLWMYERDSYGEPNNLLLIDLAQKEVINLCLRVEPFWNPVSWSPTQQQLTFIGLGDSQRPVFVFELESWQLYTVAYHDGQIIGWRED